MNNTLLSLLSFAVLLAAAAGLGAQVGEMSPAHEPALTSGLPDAVEAGSLSGSPEAVSVAECWDGTSRTCSGSYTFAQDSTCYPNRRGYCYGSDTGYKYCPSHSCPCYETVVATCDGGSTVSCSGSCSGSYAIDGCLAHCDGFSYWCPSPAPMCVE